MVLANKNGDSCKAHNPLLHIAISIHIAVLLLK